MPKKEKTGATDKSVKVQLRDLRLELDEVKLQRDGLVKEVKELKTMNQELRSVIETDLKSGLIQRITAKSSYKRVELEPLEVEQLQAIDATLTMSKPGGTFKNIRAGGSAVTDADERRTIPDLYGKTRKEVLAMHEEDA